MCKIIYMYKCAEIVYMYKYNININFISVRYMYGNSPSKMTREL